MNAIFPVARTEIGNIGIAICHEGVYPEVVRGLAMNGAEIIIRPTLIEPSVMSGRWELQNRAHAMFNQVYVVAPNLGPTIQDDGGIVDLFGGHSMIVDSRGTIVAQQTGWTSGDSSSRPSSTLRRFAGSKSPTDCITSLKICARNSTLRFTQIQSILKTNTLKNLRKKVG